MTTGILTERMRQISKLYRGDLEQRGVVKTELPPEDRRFRPYLWANQNLGHCSSMLDRVDKLLEQSKPEEAMMWLGYVQYGLIVHGIYNEEEANKHLL